MQDMDGERIQKTHQLLLWEKKTYKVMDCVHVTKTRDPVAQIHERIGTETIYENMAEKDVRVKIHAYN